MLYETYVIDKELRVKGWKYEPVKKPSFDFESNAMVDPITGNRYGHTEAIRIQKEREKKG